MATQKIETGLIADSAVTTAKLADNSVTAAKIAAGSLDDQVKGISSSADAVAITIDSSENVGIGTTSPSSYNSNANKLVIAGSGNTGLTIAAGTLDVSNIFFSDGTSGDAAYRGIFRYSHADDAFKFYTAGANERLLIGSGGDISFYEDTGTTAKFFWDASEERLGIGTTSPSVDLDVEGTAQVNLLEVTHDGDRAVNFVRTGANTFSIEHDLNQFYFWNQTTSESPLLFQNDGDVIMNGGFVGIGTSSPSAKLEVNGGSDMGIRIVSDAGGYSSLQFGDSSDSVRGGITYYSTDDSLQLRGYNNTERARLDANGNLLHGTTGTSWTNTAGTYLFYQSALNVTRDGAESVNLNRLTSDGDIITFRKEGTTVGDIGSRGGAVSYIVLDPRASGAGLTATNDAILPSDETGNPVNNNTDLGTSSIGFKDLYLSGGAYLGGTAAGNKLDDYEEGTWSPSISSGTATFGGATYTKVGRLVTCHTTVSNFSDRTSSNIFVIGNLPFTAQDTDRPVTMGILAQYIASGFGSITGGYIDTSTSIRLYNTSSGAYDALRHNELTSASSGMYVAFSYMASS